MIDIYEYVASNNPHAAQAIINKYGYDVEGVETEADLGEMLKQVVQVEGLPALRDVVKLHPDKDLIVEEAGQIPSSSQSSSGSSGCKCGGGCGKSNSNGSAGAVAEKYVSDLQNTTGIQQGNLFLIAAALILAVAIVSK